MAKNFFYFALLSILFSFVIILVFVSGYNSPQANVDRLYRAIEKAEDDGHYKCCIEPACTMCYLGNWKFDVGTCFCDDAIREGREDDVCPACNSGLEEGLCKSREDSDVCLIQ